MSSAKHVAYYVLLSLSCTSLKIYYSASGLCLSIGDVSLNKTEGSLTMGVKKERVGDNYYCRARRLI